MSSPANPAVTRSYIMERLVGDSGDNSNVIGAGRAMAERALPSIQARLNEQLTTPVTVELSAVEVARVAEARDQAGDNFAMAIVASSMSSDALTMVMDATATAILVCGLFGGDPEEPVTPIARAYSQVEVDVAAIALEIVAEALNGSGRRSLELKLPLPAVLSGGEAARRVLRDGPGLRVIFGVSTPAATGTIAVVFPQRILLTQRGGDPRLDGDPGMANEWRDRFSEEVMRSAVRLEATMPLSRMTLSAIAGFAPGQIIEFEETARSQAKLAARDKTLFICEFGKLGQNYTVRVRHPYDAGQDFIDGLMPA